MTETELKYAYTADSGDGTDPANSAKRSCSGYRSSLALSIALHSFVALGLSLLAVAPRGFMPTFITTASFQEHPGDEALAQIITHVSEITPARQVRTSDVSVTEFANVFTRAKGKPVRVKNKALKRRKEVPRITDIASEMVASASAGSPQSKRKRKNPIDEINSRVRTAGGSTGKVQFSLVWEGRNDLDLHVVTPTGERIFFHNKKSECYAELDIDMNATAESEHPVENIHWPKSRAPEGRYTILVHYYRQHIPESAVPYRLMVKRHSHAQVVEGMAAATDQFKIHRTFYIAPHIEGAERQRRINRFKNQQRKEESLAANRLQSLLQRKSSNRELAKVVLTYPHTDAAIDAIRILCSRKQQLSQTFEAAPPQHRLFENPPIAVAWADSLLIQP